MKNINDEERNNNNRNKRDNYWLTLGHRFNFRLIRVLTILSSKVGLKLSECAYIDTEEKTKEKEKKKMYVQVLLWMLLLKVEYQTLAKVADISLFCKKSTT